MSIRKGVMAALAVILGALGWAAAAMQSGAGTMTPSQSEWIARCPGSAPVSAKGTFNSAEIPRPLTVDLRTAPATSMMFERRDLITNMDYSYGIAVADFDCNDRWDISMFDSWGGRRTRQLGALGFLSYGAAPPTLITWFQTWPELNQPVSLAYLLERHVVFDVNGDKLPDIVGVANSHGAVIAYLNPGTDAIIGSWRRRDINANVPAPISLVQHDVDNDGLLDLVVTMRVQPSTDPNPSIRGVVWLKNPGAESTDPWVRSAIGPSDNLIEPRNLQIADFDKDGRPDVYVADAATGIASLFLQTSAGQWTRHDQNVSAYHGHFGTTVDEDNDGVPEIIQPGYLCIMRLKFDPMTKTWARRFLASFKSEGTLIVPSDIAIADVDEDGSGDIVFSILTLLSDANGFRRGGIYMMRKANDWKIETVAHTNDSIVEIKLVDINGDKLTDIVANAEYPSQGVAIYRQATEE